MSMQGVLQGLMAKQGAPGGAGPNPPSLGMGPPPGMPGLPPPPEGVGAMPTGSQSTTAKAAADAAILALRDAKGYYPSLGQAIDGCIDQIKSAAAAPAPTPPAVGQPTSPGAATSEASPTMDSGTPGAI
jgi:hypothetical protein